MTRMTPRRFIILQFRHIFLTDADTLMKTTPSFKEIEYRLKSDQVKKSKEPKV